MAADRLVTAEKAGGRSPSQPGDAGECECDALCAGDGLPMAEFTRGVSEVQSVYYHFYKWSRNGTLYRINRVLGYLARRQLGRFARPSAGVVDSQSAKTQDYGDLRGYDGHKKVKERKRHLLTDSLGNVFEVVVSAANTSDVDGATLVLTQVDKQIA